jgi:rod shape-determining protein MreC
MRDLFRFLYRQRNNLLFLALLAFSMSLLVRANMHHRAQAISSSNAIIGGIYSWRNSITEYTDLREKNRALSAELARERERNRAMSNTPDSARLFQDTVRLLRYRFIPAQVINSTVHKEKNYLTLDKGLLDGVRADMGVIGPDGIVGVVREASEHYALVISVLNGDHAASAQLKGTGHLGQLKWNTSDPATVALTDIDKHVPIHEGDTVLTRGSEGIYPPGIMIGIVSSVVNDPSIPFHVITVRLSEDMTRAAQVQVVSDLLRAEKDSLEAKAPAQ